MVEIPHLLARGTGAFLAAVLACSRASAADDDPTPARDEPVHSSEHGRRVAHPGPSVVLRAGMELGYRRFDDTELRGAPRRYEALPIPAVFLGVEVAPSGDGPLAFEASISQSLGLHSTTDDALVSDSTVSTLRTLGTSFTRLDTAAKYRFFLGNARSAYVAPLLGFSYSRFAFDDAPRGSEVPSGTYDVIRAGVEGRISFASLGLFATAEYDQLVAIGYLGESAPASSGPGTTVRAGASLALFHFLSARLEASYTLWAYDMIRSVPALATDQYVACRLGLEASF